MYNTINPIRAISALQIVCVNQHASHSPLCHCRGPVETYILVVVVLHIDLYDVQHHGELTEEKHSVALENET